MSVSQPLTHEIKQEAAVATPAQPAATETPQALQAAAVPTLESTEKLLADYFGKHIPAGLLPKGLDLKLEVHQHEGRENLNLTFLLPDNEGFGLASSRFSEAAQKAIRDFPAFSQRLSAEEGKESIATLQSAETPANMPNALRFVLKFDTPQIEAIANELHGTGYIPPQPAQPQNDNAPEAQEQAPAPSAELGNGQPPHTQPSQTEAQAVPDNIVTSAQTPQRVQSPTEKSAALG